MYLQTIDPNLIELGISGIVGWQGPDPHVMIDLKQEILDREESIP